MQANYGLDSNSELSKNSFEVVTTDDIKPDQQTVLSIKSEEDIKPDQQTLLSIKSEEDIKPDQQTLLSINSEVDIKPDRQTLLSIKSEEDIKPDRQTLLSIKSGPRGMFIISFSQSIVGHKSSLLPLESNSDTGRSEDMASDSKGRTEPNSDSSGSKGVSKVTSESNSESDDDFVFVRAVDAEPDNRELANSALVEKTSVERFTNLGLQWFFEDFLATGFFKGVLTQAQFSQVTQGLSTYYGFSIPMYINYIQGPDGPAPADFLIGSTLREWSAARAECCNDLALPNLVAFRQVEFQGLDATTSFIGFFRGTGESAWTLIHQPAVLDS
ncbi:hypothetical protein PGTUg99_008375 [Puccinia graminis f. sp. tritici]|uniref:Uncharacterized protein n=1 Tax=Puccinia graminis f. sp. tritici TaxID=56615 RepID=A0A5B0QGF9_PUCGR|nr:hypothetical protein PGTUg99_008375 [Puccinia graminis f. sp. tritici]